MVATYFAAVASSRPRTAEAQVAGGVAGLTEQDGVWVLLGWALRYARAFVAEAFARGALQAASWSPCGQRQPAM